MKRILALTIVFSLVMVIGTSCSKPPRKYSVNLIRSDFVTGINNHYLPLIPGSKWTYEAHLKDGTVERNEVEILNETYDVNDYENGTLVGHAGSWEWGKDGALPGVIMWADPSAHLNEEYYQEYYAGEAEDKG